MDKCQPVQIKLDSNQDVYFLFIESEKLIKQRDPECYFYICSLPLVNGMVYFKSADDALSDAMKRSSTISKIKSIAPTIGFDEFYDDRDLQKYVSP
jgi:hypothetical protein